MPLLAAYFALAVLYAWQAWRREVPTIFTDELEMAQISRSIAETGWPGRRGESHGFTSLVPWLTAPGWWIDDTETAFATIKYLQTLVMTAAIFPAYLLARTVVSHPWARVRGRGRDRRTGALLRADARRGAVRVSGCDAGALAAREDGDPHDVAFLRARVRRAVCSQPPSARS